MNSFAHHAKSWPFEEAKRVLNRIQNQTPKKGYVLFETGYGPSGLPHIGTFGEVARTNMVRHAFHTLSSIPTRLFCFSDDMDGLRKVPDNVPNQDKLRQYLGKPLTRIPDPFEKYESFGDHNNAKLRSFLDSFGFSYEFQSATDWYTSGRFDNVLRLVLERYDEIIALMLPTLGEERRLTYSPFLPICPRTGKVLQVKILHKDVDAGTIVYGDEETGQLVEVPVTKGRCKLQWKIDWAMRWCSFDVDYEMSGKDLIDSVRLSSQICRHLGGRPPESFIYELFLDEQGQKISKSKGNGLTIDEWLTYAPIESLAYYMFQSLRKAKRLYFDIIPKNVDEYLSMLSKYENDIHQRDNPVWHIHSGHPPKSETGSSFSILLNLASICNAEDSTILWGFVTRYQPHASPKSCPFLDKLIKHAVKYYQDFVKPQKSYRLPDELEREALLDLLNELKKIDDRSHTSDNLQTIIYKVGKRHDFENLRIWFGTLYEVLLGQREGPRMDSFIALYGIQETINLIETVLSQSSRSTV